MSDRKSDFFMVERGHFEFRDPSRIGGIMLEPLPFAGGIYSGTICSVYWVRLSKLAPV